jgi:hypothetical protein
MTDAPPPEDDEAERRRTNLILLIVVLLLVGGGVWIFNALLENAQDSGLCRARATQLRTH